MTVQAQLFTASHAEALRRTDALDAGRTPADAVHLDLPALSPVDLELLDIPGRWGRLDAFGRGRVHVEQWHGNGNGDRSCNDRVLRRDRQQRAHGRTTREAGHFRTTLRYTALPNIIRASLRSWSSLVPTIRFRRG